jgi:hypothetical protein
MNILFRHGLAVALLAAVPLSAATLTPPAPASATTPARRLRIHPHNVLVSAQRALNAAQMFLAKAPEDSAGDRAKAQEAVETALKALAADLSTVHGK